MCQEERARSLRLQTAERVGKSDAAIIPRRSPCYSDVLGFAAYVPSSSVTSRRDSLPLKLSLVTRRHPADTDTGDRDRRTATEERKSWVGSCMSATCRTRSV